MEKLHSDEDVKPSLYQIQKVSSFSRQGDRLNSTSDALTERDFGADVKIEKLCSLDDVKPVSLFVNQFHYGTSPTGQEDGLNYNSRKSRNESSDGEMSKHLPFTTYDSKPVTKNTLISPKEAMLVNRFKKERLSPIELSKCEDEVVIYPTVDPNIEGSVNLENDIAGRPCSDIPLLKTEIKDEDDSRSFSNYIPDSNESSWTKDRLKMELGDDFEYFDNAVEHLSDQNKQESGITEKALCHPNDISRCHLCDEIFITPQLLCGHLKEIHKDQDQAISKKVQAQSKEPQGLEAYKTFTASNNSNEKVRTQGENSFKCYQCHKTFNQSCNLRSHLRKHTGEKPFRCDHCYKSFSQSCNLRSHMKTHTGEKSFNCDQCDKSFHSSCNLRSHMRTHREEKPFKCYKCFQCLSRAGSLRRHMMIHTRETPFKCDQCPKAFNQKDYLHKHMKLHTREKPFECTQCPPQTCQPSNMWQDNLKKRTFLTSS